MKGLPVWQNHLRHGCSFSKAKRHYTEACRALKKAL